MRAGRERDSERKFSATVRPSSTRQKTVVTPASQTRSAANRRPSRQTCQAALRQILFLVREIKRQGRLLVEASGPSIMSVVVRVD